MEKNNFSSGPKVSQIANIFQRKGSSIEDEKEPKDNSGGNVVMRTESHAARFNNARALFEKLGEVRMPTTFSIRHSTSKDDNLKDLSPERQRTPSPKKKNVATFNGLIKNDVPIIQNLSRLKMEKPDKPEKPERKINSKELIEKQKNWTSHFKSRSSATIGIKRFDVIRTVPGINTTTTSSENNKIQDNSNIISTKLLTEPLIRDAQNPPETMPRTTSRSNSITSPTKSCNSNKTSSEKMRSERQIRSEGLSDASCSRTSDSNHSSKFCNNSSFSFEILSAQSSVTSSVQSISSESCSSYPSSPVHTEYEKQENESNEKVYKGDSNSKGKPHF